jgi:hypothetical protein
MSEFASPHRLLDPRSHMDPSIPPTFFFGDARDGSFAFAFGTKRPRFLFMISPHFIHMDTLWLSAPIFS